MKITKTFDNHSEWLEFRRHSVGSSEIAAVCGVSKWATPLDVYRRKTEDAEEEQSIAMMMGHAGEPVVAEWFCRETGAEVMDGSEGEFIVYDEAAPWRTASPDRYVTMPDGTQAVLECKTCNSYAKMTTDIDELWREYPHYLLQVIWQMGVTGIHTAYLAWIKDNREFGYVQVPYDEETWQGMAQKADAFCRDHLLAMIAPEPSTAAEWSHVETIAEGVTADADIAAAVDRVKELTAEIKSLDEQKAAELEKIQTYMGANELLTDESGTPLATWKMSKASLKFDEKAFKAACPDEWKKYAAERAGSRRFLMK